MKPEELYNEWTSGESTGMRPERVQTLRDDLMQATGQSIPRRISEIEAFLNNPQWRAVITRKLEDAAEGSDSSD